MELEIKIRIKNVQDWNTDWNNKEEVNSELEEFESDLKIVISEYCEYGVNFDDIEVENISVINP